MSEKRIGIFIISEIHGTKEHKVKLKTLSFLCVLFQDVIETASNLIDDTNQDSWRFLKNRVQNLLLTIYISGDPLMFIFRNNYINVHD